MSDRENTQVVQGLYDSFNAGDITAVLAALSDDVEWVLPSIPKIPFSGAKHGKDGVAEFFGTMAEHQEPQSFEVQGIIAQGDQVVARGHYLWHVKTTGRAGKASSLTTSPRRGVRSRDFTSTSILLPPWLLSST